MAPGATGRYGYLARRPFEGHMTTSHSTMHIHLHIYTHIMGVGEMGLLMK